MITRSHRFHGYGSLRYIYRNGNTIRGPLCSLKFLNNQRRQSYRLSVVVNRKVNRSAVVRNKIRRRLYEAVRLLEPQITEPYDLVFSVFSDQIAEIPADELSSLVRAQLRQARVIQAKNAKPPVIS